MTEELEIDGDTVTVDTETIDFGVLPRRSGPLIA